MPYTLLLADDSVTIQRVIELTFADEDITVVAVSDGDQAIERLEASPPDIVLADIGMPGKSGYEVAQYIHQSPKLSHIPVVLLTGAFEPVDQARADAAGCDGVLAKPFEPQLVIGRVKELLARTPRGSETTGPASRGADEVDTRASSHPTPNAMGTDDTWTSFPTERHPIAPQPDSAGGDAPFGTVARGDLNVYFDRLDAAFSKFSPNADASIAPPSDAKDHEAAGLENDLTWFSTAVSETGSSEPWDLPPPPVDVAPLDLPLSFGSAPPEAPSALPGPQESFAAVNDVEPIADLAPIVEAASTIEAPPIGETAATDHVAPTDEAVHAGAASTDEAPQIAGSSTAETGPSLEPIAAPDERLAPIEASVPVGESVPIEEGGPIGQGTPTHDIPIEAGVPIEQSARIEQDSTPVSPAEPAEAVASVAPVGSDGTSAAGPSVPAASALELPLPHPPPLPSLADAFAALLAAEQGEPSAAGALWPAAAPPPPLVVSDEVIETITRRVLDRLSDTVIREAVSDVASKIAERLIQEEIERIKASIK